MTEIPEHLLKRSKAARDKAGGDDDDAAAATGSDSTSDDDGVTIPRSLLEQSQQQAAAGGPPVPAAGGGGVATLTPPPPGATGPGGHTQRLLTVVRSGSIQDIKSKPVDKVHTWPHLLAVEFGAALFITAFLLIFAIFVNAPLLELANFDETPNPSKAPWYFLGLQELLTMFHPMIAGVTIPGVVLGLLALSPYLDRNLSNRPEDRKFMISLMTIHLMFWAILTLIGSFFRGPGFNFTFPWDTGLDGIFHL
jgi:hypothetical protein